MTPAPSPPGVKGTEIVRHPVYLPARAYVSVGLIPAAFNETKTWKIKIRKFQYHINDLKIILLQIKL